MEYYYKIRIYEPYDHSDEIIISHTKEYSNFELSSIIQEVIDGAIEDYAAQEKYVTREYYPCNMKIILKQNNMSGYPEGFLGIILSRLHFDYGFEIITPMETIDIQETHLFDQEYNDDNPAYLYSRYKDLILGECNNCYRKNWESFKGCPVNNERRRNIQ